MLGAALGVLVGFGLTASRAGELDDCLSAHTSNVEWAACTRAEIQRQENELGAAWERLWRLMEDKWPEEKGNLRAEQEAWTRWKEASCWIYRSEEFGREGAVLHYPSCIANKIADRTKELEFIRLELETRR